MELHKQHHEETERATMVLQRMQSTYKNQLSHYREQNAATVLLIKQIKDERQAAENKSEMGLARIQCILGAWQNKTKRLIDERSMQWWAKWAKHMAELQLLRADAENRQKDGDDCYMLTKEDFTIVRDELAGDFGTLAEEKLAVVWQLVA